MAPIPAPVRGPAPHIAPFALTWASGAATPFRAKVERLLRPFGDADASPHTRGFATVLTVWQPDGTVRPDTDAVESYDLHSSLDFDMLLTAAAVLDRTRPAMTVTWDRHRLTVDVVRDRERHLLVATPLTAGQYELLGQIHRAPDGTERLPASAATTALGVSDAVGHIAARLDRAGVWQRTRAPRWHPGRGRQRPPVPVLALAADLVAHGLEDWSAGDLAAVTRLADGWAGTVEDLLEVAGALVPTGSAASAR